MRTLKFRTWSKQAQCIIPWEELKPKFVKLLDNPEYPYMQFTGLLDKSGVEIYEGDIITGYYGSDKYTKEIEWSTNGYPELLWDNKEVIGNIYDNPKLLG